MRRITLSLSIGALILLSGARVTGAAPSAPEFPFKPGTSWVYRHTLNEGGGTPDEEGTFTLLYHGETTYRGNTYHCRDATHTLYPRQTERAYMVWSGGEFRTAAIVVYDGPNTLEILLDRTYAFTGAGETVSGVAQVYRNAVNQGPTQWTYTTSQEGNSKVTVPAGTFMASVHTGRIRLGALERIFRIYAVGSVDVRIELDSYRQKDPTNPNTRELVERSIFELVSGPI